MEQLFDTSITADAQSALEFISSILQASTEYSMIGFDLAGTIRLWSEGARHMYGYSPLEMVCQTNIKILFTTKDIQAGLLNKIINEAIKNGKWQGNLTRVRKNGEEFTAYAIFTPYFDKYGKVIGILLISRDLTGDYSLIEQLKATQFYTRSLIESTIDPLITTDPIGMITDVNQQMEKLTGLDRNKLIGTPFKNYFSDPQLAEEGLRLTLREGKVKNYELTAVSKEGHETIVSFNATIFKNEQNELVGIFASARDITEQKLIELKLRASESYNRSLIEASADALFAISPYAIITDVNEEATRLTGYNRDILINSYFPNYFTDAERAKVGVEKTLKEKHVTNYEMSLITKNKQSVLVDFSAGAYVDNTGQVGGILASARDISVQKSLEQRLVNAQYYVRSLIESNIDGLVTTDPLGVITDVNEQMVKMTGYTREMLIGSAFKDYFTDPKRAENGIRLVLQKKQVSDYQLTIKTNIGNEIIVSFNATVFYDQDGKLQGMFAAARDITRYLEIQSNLQKTLSALENTNKELNEFMMIATHDLQEPLRMISSFSQLLQKRYKDKFDKEANEYFEFVVNGAHRLQLMLNDLLMYSHIMGCKSAFVNVDTNQALQNALHNLAGPIKEKNAVITHDTLPVIKACPIHFEKMFENLIDNAIKFNERQPKIHVGVKESENEYIFSVEDNGIGVDMQYQYRIFGLFKLLNPKHKYPGIGIGLPFCAKVMDHHQGHIWLKSKLGEGSTFYFSVPKSTTY